MYKKNISTYFVSLNQRKITLTLNGTLRGINHEVALIIASNYMHFCILAWLAVFEFPALAFFPIQSKNTVDILNVILGKNVPALVQGQGLAQLREIQSDHVIREGAGVAGPSPLFRVHDPDRSHRQDPAVEKDEDGLARPVECRRTVETVGRRTDAVGLHPLEDGLRPDEGRPPDEGKWFLFLQNVFVIFIFSRCLKLFSSLPFDCSQ